MSARMFALFSVAFALGLALQVKQAQTTAALERTVRHLEASVQRAQDAQASKQPVAVREDPPPHEEGGACAETLRQERARLEALASRIDRLATERLEPSPPPASDAPTINDGALRARADAQRLFEHSLQSGVWDDGSVASFRALALQLPAEDVAAFARDLARALNEGRLKPLARGAML